MFENLGKTALFWSSGLDSTLVLAMMIEAKAEFDIIHIRDFWGKAELKRADALIKKWNLKTFSYPPMSVSFIGNDTELTAVFEYAVTGGAIPMLRDVTDGTRCIAELDGLRMYQPPFVYDTYVVGSRKDDTHWAFENQVIPGERWQVGNANFYAPLYDLNRQEVIAKSLEYGLDVEKEVDENDVSLCTRCLQGETVFCPAEQKYIPPIQWDKAFNTRLFRESYASRH